MSQPLVLAIEPDLRQAAIVKRIVREKVLADVAVVDSRDAALEAMRTMMPDVLLVSALISPRDEEELVAHLRTLEHADHLQTHTIPQLASALKPAESRGPRGLLAAFRRKKETAAAPSGCDPDLFAEEIRVFLQRAADRKRERSIAGPDRAPAPAWRAAPQPPDGVVPDTESAVEPASASASSWSSPFEWKPSNPSSPIAHPESLIPDPESPIPDLGSSVGSAESLMAHLRPPAGIPTLDDLTKPPPPIQLEEAPSIEIEPTPIQVDENETPTLILVAQPVAAVTPIADPVPTQDPVPIQDAAPIKDPGLGIRDERLGISDSKPYLPPLAAWVRAEKPVTALPAKDDVRGLLAGLAVPPAVVSVGQGRGCRIRRVRVVAVREAADAEKAGAGLLSDALPGTRIAAPRAAL